MAFTVGAGEDDDISVGIAEPNLAVLGRGVEVGFEDDVGTEGARTLHCRIEIVYLKPEQDTVSVGRGVWVDEVGVVLLVPGVELKEQLTGARDALVEVAVMVFLKSVCLKEFGVPATARTDIANGDEGLGGDGRVVRGGGHDD
jgi:hypothetical protein